MKHHVSRERSNQWNEGRERMGTRQIESNEFRRNIGLLTKVGVHAQRTRTEARPWRRAGKPNRVKMVELVEGNSR